MESALLPVNNRRVAERGASRRARARAGRRRGDERGGAVSLWVVLMVPVSAFAAVVAMAGPQRLAAESSVQEAADDLAMFAVAWRDGHQLKEGPLPAFFDRCDEISAEHQEDLELLELDWLLLVNLPTDDPPGRGLPSDDLEVVAARQALDARDDEIKRWSESCERLFEALVRDLGYLGVDMGSLRGSYSDSLTESPLTGICQDTQHTTGAACTGAGQVWTPDPQFHVPCRTSEQTVVRDAVHVVLAADWQHAGWAAAQVWPDGIPMAAESTGRLSQRDPASSDIGCGEQLVVLDSQGRPVWAGPDPEPPSRRLAQSTRRSALSG